MSASLGPLVTTTELAAALETEAPVVVLDTTWALDYEGPDSPLARYRDGHIPGARHFDGVQPGLAYFCVRGRRTTNED